MVRFLASYFQKVGAKRVAACLAGNLLMGFGIALFKLSALGNDPYTGMNMGLAGRLGIAFPLVQLGVNLIFFLLQLRFERRLIGFGTLVNALLIGSLVDWSYGRYAVWFGLPGSFGMKLLCMAVGMVICSFGLSLYQMADLGVSPYDAAALILDKRLARVPYFWCRMLTDGLCTLVCWLSGGIVGLGTLVCAFGFGPVIGFFNRLLSPFFHGAKGSA